MARKGLGANMKWGEGAALAVHDPPPPATITSFSFHFVPVFTPKMVAGL